jgi:hypothetical protein
VCRPRHAAPVPVSASAATHDLQSHAALMCPASSTCSSLTAATDPAARWDAALRSDTSSRPHKYRGNVHVEGCTSRT